jgi:hypothetical protein
MPGRGGWTQKFVFGSGATRRRDRASLDRWSVGLDHEPARGDRVRHVPIDAASVSAVLASFATHHGYASEDEAAAWARTAEGVRLQLARLQGGT